MNTSKYQSIRKLDNEFVEGILHKLIAKYNIIQIFYSSQKNSKTSTVIIHLERKSDADELRLKHLVKKALQQYQMNICFVYSVRLHDQYDLGHPVIEAYCQRDAVIYQNEGSIESLLINRNWKKYKEKFFEFEERFYHDHTMQVEQIDRLIKEDASNSVFTSYERLIECHLDNLEELYTLNVTRNLNLKERIKMLIDYVPELEMHFVKKNHKEYYLTDLFNQAKESAKQDEKIYKSELYEAVRITEESLCSLVELRFKELRKKIKKNYSKPISTEVSTINFEKEHIDEILQTAVDKILSLVEVEQIYNFSKMVYGEFTIYYLLLVGLNISNENLKTITKSLKKQSGETYDFVLISHDRSWIQQNLFQYQEFFVYIMQGKHLIYSSHPYYPELHWENPHTPYHGDLYFHFKAAYDTALQFFRIAENPEENYQGLHHVFTLFFLSFCRTYIYVKTFYLPNYLSMRTLWNLCIYADTEMRKYGHLFTDFWTDIFLYMNYHMHLHHSVTKLDKEQVGHMKVIVEKLLNELENTIEKRNLLTNNDKELLYGKAE